MDFVRAREIALIRDGILASVEDTGQAIGLRSRSVAPALRIRLLLALLRSNVLAYQMKGDFSLLPSLCHGRILLLFANGQSFC